MDLTIPEKLKTKLNEVALEAIGHFFCGWKEEDAPHILNPYTHNLCQKQHGSAYPEFSSYLLYHENQIVDLLQRKGSYDQADIDFIDDLNETCHKIFNSIDEDV